ncbi:Protein CBG00140 [Caenorhabditis briggsae]|uniref:Protein CBG00140 n=2 Tax=Caenorhabditis briggsae TaxID=6238 RepID=A8WMD4_CAEBR|nr:Protein CBG00140 [Caenorhabditis briggsae]ULT83549.1 hypothetical protein L3Y34_012641 [Caenorhabditis briggsae]CAP21638.1 Protein CBG00140 [Caenorhabditis briggsae]
MRSFQPYQKQESKVEPVRPTVIAKAPVTRTNVERKIPKIHYMERELNNGKMVRIPVVDDNAVFALMANGFKRCYAAPGDVESIETNPENLKHVICRPSPFVPIVEQLTPFSLATLLQPSPQQLYLYHARQQTRRLRRTKNVTAEEYAKALAGDLNPLLKKYRTHKRQQKSFPMEPRMPQGKYPEPPPAVSVAEEIFVDVETIEDEDNAHILSVPQDNSANLAISK